MSRCRQFVCRPRFKTGPRHVPAMQGLDGLAAGLPRRRKHPWPRPDRDAESLPLPQLLDRGRHSRVRRGYLSTQCCNCGHDSSVTAAAPSTRAMLAAAITATHPTSAATSTRRGPRCRCALHCYGAGLLRARVGHCTRSLLGIRSGWCTLRRQRPMPPRAGGVMKSCATAVVSTTMSSFLHGK